MMELGLELLLKEPVITKVLFSIFNPALRYVNCFQSNRKMLGEGGPEAVRFYLDLLKRIEAAEREDHKHRDETILDFPKPFFL